MNPRLRYTELELKKANAGLSGAEAKKLERYRRLVSRPDPNISAGAWKFWQRVRKASGFERRELMLKAVETQIAEAWP